MSKEWFFEVALHRCSVLVASSKVAQSFSTELKKIEEQAASDAASAIEGALEAEAEKANRVYGALHNVEFTSKSTCGELGHHFKEFDDTVPVKLFPVSCAFIGSR